MKKGIIALLACVFALSLALVGCGGGGGDAKAAWVGTWDLYEMEENGQITSTDDIQMLRDLGLTVTLELKDDGNGALVMFGESLEGTWEAKSATEGSFTAQDQTVGMTIADGKLTMEQNGSKLVFQKGEATASSSAASAASASAESAESESASASSASS